MTDPQVALANLGGRSGCVKIYKQKQNVQKTRKEDLYKYRNIPILIATVIKYD